MWWNISFIFLSFWLEKSCWNVIKGIRGKAHNRHICMSIAKDEEPRPLVNPCVLSPCGPYSECRDINGQASCACLPTYIGTPPNCRPECSVNPECPTSQACIQRKCRNPCDGVCGVGAICNVIRHTPTCSCPNGFTGDPFVVCRPIIEEGKIVTRIFVVLFIETDRFRRIMSLLILL